MFILINRQATARHWRYFTAIVKRMGNKQKPNKWHDGASLLLAGFKAPVFKGMMQRRVFNVSRRGIG
ncbi:MULTISPECIES: hypothetical protein [Serratia]|jgi:hypothetical protein|uniref:hypothetical protein n=1 Tax=Serratia TaxID=613 RepID=UPI001179F0A9|nr:MULTISPECIES: hypothetical protein [Serratia]MBH1927820.1 hypothetical protein [Serratia ureilytica]MBH2543056.1 hypothetical protein [Serratia ureilytica]MBH2616468.1 hypothetical protein [Serratia ureilytica]MBH2651651.1 hypothetical protein [Serratia ureilytica]MBH2904170.1 hypothetical protein [Serratia ureilytica]